MKKKYVVHVVLAFFALGTYNAALSADEAGTPSPAMENPVTTLSKKEIAWIEGKCKALHPINADNYKQCVDEKEQEKLQKKAQEQINKTTTDSNK